MEEGLKEADAYVEIGIDPNLAFESYKIIKVDDSHFVINGADNLGLIYGVGRFLHRGYKNLKDEFCVPQKSIRAIYYATHFGNFY